MEPKRYRAVTRSPTPAVLTVLTAPRVTVQVVLETEYDNAAALSLYESLGFIREKRLFRFYLNGKDAFRLVLVVPPQDDDEGGNGRAHQKILPLRYIAPARMISVAALSYDSDDDVSSR